MIQESLFIIPIYDWDSEEGYRALHAHPPSLGTRFCKLCKPYIPGVTRRGKKVKKEVVRQPGRKAASNQAEKGRGVAHSRPKAAKKKILISDEDRAKEAVEALDGLQNRLATLRMTSGIDALEARIDKYKVALVNYCVDNKRETVNLDDGRYARIISAAFDKRVITTERELSELEPEGATLPTKTLWNVVSELFDENERAEIWNRITRPVADIAALDELVAEGKLTVDDLAPTYYERKKSPYVRIF